MATVVVTGSAGGIGIATRRRLEADGHRVIGVDVRDAEVLADLGTPGGREEAVRGVEELAAGLLDGVVAGAGIFDAPDDAIVSVNYFAAVAVLEGLLPLLARGTDPSAVAISSNSATTQPGLPAELVDSCLAGDEVEARQVAARHRGAGYAGSKLALARWVRRRATTAEWAGAGVRLNAVAPGPIVTPMIEANLDFIMNLGDVFPVPQGRPGRPEQVASLLAYLLSPEAAFFCGSLIFMDGGTDAALRAEDWPVAKP